MNRSRFFLGFAAAVAAAGTAALDIAIMFANKMVLYIYRNRFGLNGSYCKSRLRDSLAQRTIVCVCTARRY